MLVGTRKGGESLTVGDEIVITVVETRPGSVRIGIEAPSEIRVLCRQWQREELGARLWS
ncbi:carbon storage regulator [Ferrimicrobium acidiphilum]|uniref:carbon storage regulator n=1 Tax=Ferrimicrobium acidiphilum TaxID=121039 RepID=UPI0023F512D7|nr:carbon storage regulator [Ferrimicrobium acidiphilum]